MKQIEAHKVLAPLADNIQIKEITFLENNECDLKYQLKPIFFDLLESKKFKKMFEGMDLDPIVKTVILKIC